MKNITIYLGSKTPANPIYSDACRTLGTALAKQNLACVYGGANVGTMKVLADSVLEHGGAVIGVIPEVLQAKEILHPNLTETYIVHNMHERKAKMMDLGDGFIALPGGCGTMEEIFEVITWSQIGIHTKPFVFLNLDNFYDGIKHYMDHAHSIGFISDEDYEHIHFANTPEDALTVLMK